MRLYELRLSMVLTSDDLLADETTLPVLDPGRGQTRIGGCGAVRWTTGRGRPHAPGCVYVYSENRQGGTRRPISWHSAAHGRWTAIPGSDREGSYQNGNIRLASPGEITAGPEIAPDTTRTIAIAWKLSLLADATSPAARRACKPTT